MSNDERVGLLWQIIRQQVRSRVPRQPFSRGLVGVWLQKSGVCGSLPDEQRSIWCKIPAINCVSTWNNSKYCTNLSNPVDFAPVHVRSSECKRHQKGEF